MADRDDEVIRAGIMKKKGTRIYGERYFVLKGPVLYYYLKKTDSEPKGTLVLNGDCKISWVKADAKKKQFIFEISWPVVDIADDDKGVSSKIDIKKKSSSSKILLKGNEGKKIDPEHAKAAAIAAGGVVAGSMTSGIGLFASLLVMGAASGNRENIVGSSENQKTIVLCCETIQDAELWIQAIHEQIKELGDSAVGFGGVPGLSIESSRNEPPPEIRLDEIEEWIKSSKWKLYEVHEGIRIFEQNFADESSDSSTKQITTATSNDPPCLRINVPLNGSVRDALALLIKLPPSCRNGIVKSLRVISTIDNNTDIIHVCLERVFLNPSWSDPRDLCLTRYWKQNSDGSCVVCLDSVFHHDCPLVEGYTRADLHAAYYITPVKEDVDEDQALECMLTMIAQIQTKGWVPKSYGYQHHYLKQFLLHVLDIRDTIDNERFQQITLDPVAETRRLSTAQNEVALAPSESNGTANLSTIPPPLLPTHMWGDTDASTFRVRGASYLQDKVKCSAGPSLFKLEALDIFEVPEAQHNVAAHPRNRIALAHQRGEKFWAFVFNIMVPGPPFYSFVVYFSGDKSLLEQDTPFGRIARPFFLGNDDEFRNNRFKLIPKIVDGNFVVKMAVKDTPTLLGNKLKQYYYKDDHYFEIDVDVGSSSVARNIVGLAIGYSKSIVLDLGLCLQGNEENELPEVMLGCASVIRADMTLSKKI